MDNIFWVETTKEVYFAIYKAHHEEFCVFGSCTLPNGDPRLGKINPFISTEWGFKDATDPLIKGVQTKDNHEQKEYDWKYFIAFSNVTQDD
ncbi:hypothetical protein LCGC14_0388200 [marine sediment metagenome]|uniref:Uncharacterized protein n=1 Tax=marine sediment metagenome TaxID=412755 RepID=A0A0F9W963_9ZZZZ